jgi:hypothetical protein
MRIGGAGVLTFLAVWYRSVGKADEARADREERREKRARAIAKRQARRALALRRRSR